MKKSSCTFLMLILIISFSGLFAQETIEEKSAKPWMEIPKETLSVTKHSIKIDGKTINYTATAGTYILKDYEGKPLANFFYISYMKDGVTNFRKRPLLFSFNGGPGTASIWLHMGVLGPRRPLYDKDGFELQPPVELVDNEYSIIDVADVVFIDPVGTGYSRMVPGEDPHMFHGKKEDIESVGQFINMYVTRNNRWNSPKFIIGESYGTTRASGLAGHMQGRYQMFLNGIILVSTMVLEVETGGDINYSLILPHYTATAWYHKQLPSDLQNKPLQEVLDEVEEFAMNDYLVSLAKGGYIPESEKTEIVSRLARYTGLSRQYIINTNLRVNRGAFRKELLRDENRTVGRLDSRYRGIDKDAAGTSIEYDPGLAAWEGGFSTTFNHYIRTELKYETEHVYEVWGNVRPWKRDDSMNIGETLRKAMTENKYLKVHVLEGYYDAACDYFSALYAFSHIDMNGELKDRIHFDFYESGHMMYIHESSLVKMKKDLRNFVESACPK